MFLWYDYVMLISVLLVSTLIGIYFGYFNKKQATANEYLFGGKKMKIVPVAISAAVGHISAITFVGIVADVYRYGAFWLYINIAIILIVCSAIFIFYPVLFKLNIISAYEYLYIRFDDRTRMIGSALYILYENLFLPVTVFSPALALSVVIGINVNLISTVICGICVFYTAIGGLRTVIWTDLLQFTIIVVSLVIILAFGITSVGGISNVWNTAIAGGRFDIFDFDPNPTKKDSFWICTIGLATRCFYYFCLNQSAIQKYLSLPSYGDCIKSMVYSSICMTVMINASVLLGLVIYVHYVDCDPFINTKIAKIDHIVPYYVSQMAKKVPGLNGLFMATLLSASISTLSSSLNSLSGVIYRDFISKCLKEGKSEQQVVTILKLIVVIEGAVCAGLIFILQHLGDIIPLSMGITGLLDGPSVGLFTLGVLFPRVNAKSAFYASVGGVITMATIYFPAMYYNYQNAITYPGKPSSIDGCTDSINITAFNRVNSTTSNEWQPFALFRISYYYYCFIGMVATVVLGLMFSYFTRDDYTAVDTKKANEALEINEMGFHSLFNIKAM